MPLTGNSKLECVDLTKTSMTLNYNYSKISRNSYAQKIKYSNIRVCCGGILKATNCVHHTILLQCTLQKFLLYTHCKHFYCFPTVIFSVPHHWNVVNHPRNMYRVDHTNICSLICNPFTRFFSVAG